MTDLHVDALIPDPWPSWVKRAIWACLAILLIVSVLRKARHAAMGRGVID